MLTLNANASQYLLHCLTLRMFDVFIEATTGISLSLTAHRKWYSPVNKQHLLRKQIRLNDIARSVEKMSGLRRRSAFSVNVNDWLTEWK
jgi:hypothetical protein